MHSRIKISTLAGTAAALLVAGAALFADSGSAGAATGEYQVATKGGTFTSTQCKPFPGDSYDGAASGCFRADGDHIFIKDTAADGRSAGVLYWVGKAGSDYYRSGVCRDTAGKSEASYECNYNFKESQPITIRTGTCNQTASVSCHNQSDYPESTLNAPWRGST